MNDESRERNSKFRIVGGAYALEEIPSDQPFTIKGKGFQVRGDKKNFTALETPSFTLEREENLLQRILGFFRRLIGKTELALKDQVKVELVSADGEAVQRFEVREEENGELAIVAEPSVTFSPGKY